MSKNPFANMGNLLKQAQEMQSKMGKIQEEAATKPWRRRQVEGW